MQHACPAFVIPNQSIGFMTDWCLFWADGSYSHLSLDRYDKIKMEQDTERKVKLKPNAVLSAAG